MRGKEQGGAIMFFTLRITPAYAGKSEPSGFMLPTSQDHPRLCGEKPAQSILSLPEQGSPPPMRGKALIWNNFSPNRGITPAYAGKRPVVAAVLNRVRDHPRLCGEKTISRNFSRFSSGSPPPMRGKEPVVLLTLRHIGITPAYAGKSSPDVPD